MKFEIQNLDFKRIVPICIHFLVFNVPEFSLKIYDCWIVFTVRKDDAKHTKINHIINNWYLHYLESKQKHSTLPTIDIFFAERKTLNHIILYVFHSRRVIKYIDKLGGGGLKPHYTFSMWRSLFKKIRTMFF